MLTIRIWDVQHGSAAYIRTPAPKHIVNDLGIGSYEIESRTFSPLVHLKRKLGISQLDEVIISHPHGDHLDDILNFDLLTPRVLHRPKHLTEEQIWAGNKVTDEEIIEKYLEVNNRYTEPVSEENDPELPSNNGGVDIKVFSPRLANESNLNNNSLVTVITYESCKVILAGDNESVSWQALLNRTSFKDAIEGTDVFLAPHHGRESGFYSDLFNYFNPKLTVISDGRFCDTSATDRYDQVTTGWAVHRRSGADIKRKCVTTRHDGDIFLKIGRNSSDNRPFISVTID